MQESNFSSEPDDEKLMKDVAEEISFFHPKSFAYKGMIFILICATGLGKL